MALELGGLVVSSGVSRGWSFEKTNDFTPERWLNLGMETSVPNIHASLIDVLGSEAEFIYLLGSAETERFHAESDIDVAVFWKPSVSDKQIHGYWGELEKRLSRDVDLVSINTADIIFSRQILETGRLVLNKDPGTLLNWKVKVLSEYPDFKASRKIIEDNILNRKKYV